MINTIKEDTILQSIDTGQFSVIKLETDNRYTLLMSTYPKQFHRQITYAFRLHSEPMIKELMSYAEVFENPVTHTVIH
jgi:hypothetical protein